MIAFAIALANTQIHQPDKRKNPNGEFFSSLSWVVLLSKILQNCDVYVVFLQTFLLIVKLPPQKKTTVAALEPGRKPPQIKPIQTDLNPTGGAVVGGEARGQTGNSSHPRSCRCCHQMCIHH